MNKPLKAPFSILYLLACLTVCSPVMAAEPSDQTSESLFNILPSALEDLTTLNDDAAEWADDSREEVKNRLGNWANEMNDWFGEPDPANPATANLRIVIDSRWEDDPISGSEFTVKPRVRGRLRLPVLEERLSLIIGDEDLDEEAVLKQDTSKNNFTTNPLQDKTYDRQQTKEDNESIALRWSKLEDQFGFDADLGIRSGDDIYFKLSTDKTWLEHNNLTVSNHNYYRYGSQSEHTIKGEVNLEYAVHPTRLINNHTNIYYRNEADTEETTWANELRQIHYFGNDKQFSYGISTYGYVDSDKPVLNSYGPAMSYRQPFWRDWLFLQTELNYFNNKEDNKGHYPTALLRFEALF